MPIVTVQGLNKHYGDKQLFHSVNFSLAQGDRIGIVGVNGSGKSTLLKIIQGETPPDEGRIQRNPRRRIVYLPQNPVMADHQTVLAYLFAGDAPLMRLLRAYQAALLDLETNPHSATAQQNLVNLQQRMDLEDGWNAETQAKAILSRLGIFTFQTPLGELSGGQRRRVALARVLLEPADLLLLDEPTNHIDPESIEWLENHLRNIDSAVLMVTHDRYFLDRITNRIFELDGGELHNHNGNYSAFLQNKADREAQRQKTAQERDKTLQREIAWLHRTPMARGGKQQARINRALDMLEEQTTQQSGSLNINVAGRRTGKEIIAIQKLHKAFNGTPIIANLSLTVNKRARIGLVGANGVGKSTLLNLIAKRLQPDQGSIKVGQTIHLGYYDQESTPLDPTLTVLETITDVAPVITTADGRKASAAQMLERFQFSRAVQRNFVSTLSGGEKRRLYLLRTLMQAPNVLLLDEPTNDLDVQTLSTLEDYLSDFDGVVIAASHDRYFLDRTTAQILAFEGKGIIRGYAGNYSAYRAAKAQAQATSAASTNSKQVSPANHKPNPATKSRRKGLNFKEQREFEGLENRIEVLESEQQRLSAAINQSGANYQQLQTLSAELQTLENELETAMDRWADLAELAES